jgi:hypothetical protein
LRIEGYNVVSMADPYGNILGFLDRTNSLQRFSFWDQFLITEQTVEGIKISEFLF